MEALAAQETASGVEPRQREKAKMENKKNISQLKVYFASPWFRPDQAEREDRVKAKLRSLGFNVWSPKDNCVCSPIADSDMRTKVFTDNVNNIIDADILFAITDGKDMGTIWEAGFACGLNAANGYGKYKTIIYYCETLGPEGQFNLMLAQSGDIVVTRFEDLDQLPELIENGEGKEYVGIVE